MQAVTTRSKKSLPLVVACSLLLASPWGAAEGYDVQQFKMDAEAVIPLVSALKRECDQGADLSCHQAESVVRVLQALAASRSKGSARGQGYYAQLALTSLLGASGAGRDRPINSGPSLAGRCSAGSRPDGVEGLSFKSISEFITLSTRISDPQPIAEGDREVAEFARVISAQALSYPVSVERDETEARVTVLIGGSQCTVVVSDAPAAPGRFVGESLACRSVKNKP